MSIDRPTVLEELGAWLLLTLLVVAAVVYGVSTTGLLDRAPSGPGDADLTLARALLVPPPSALKPGHQLTDDPAEILRARALIQRALERSPRSAAVHHAMALLQLAEGNPGAAEVSVRRGLELDPEAFESHMLLGNLRYRAQDFEGAEAAFRRVTELQPRNFLAWHNLGQTLHLLGRTEESLDAYRRKLEVRGEPTPVGPSPRAAPPG
ncbi:MAG: tetratricopeptide repeat protein [Acidobacteriota bacterium]